MFSKRGKGLLVASWLASSGRFEHGRATASENDNITAAVGTAWVRYEAPSAHFVAPICTGSS